MENETKPIEGLSVRVYGLVVNEQGEVLLGEEYHFDQYMCKFPGGGLELGEGLRDCLLRELWEETEQRAQVGEHFYTTDYFQPIPLRPGYQLLAVYYWAQLPQPDGLRCNATPYQHTTATNGSVGFRWQKIDRELPDLLTFPTDQLVARRLVLHYFPDLGS